LTAKLVKHTSSVVTKALNSNINIKWQCRWHWKTQLALYKAHSPIHHELYFPVPVQVKLFNGWN